MGSKKNPIWRVVVADQRSPRDGRFIETIGHYNPQTNPSTIVIDEERLEHWVARGAQPTGTVKKLMVARSRDSVPASAQPAVAGAAVAEPAGPADEPAPAEEPAEDVAPAEPATAEAPTDDAGAEPAAEGEAAPADVPEAAPADEPAAAPADEPAADGDEQDASG